MDYDYIREEFKAYHLIWKGHMHLADECEETAAEKKQRIDSECKMDDRYEKMQNYVVSLIGDVMFKTMMDYKHEYPGAFFNMQNRKTGFGNSMQIYATTRDDDDYFFWVYNYRGDEMDKKTEEKIVFTVNFFNLDGITLY